MRTIRNLLWTWGPALLMMALIFGFSSQPSTALPNLHAFDKLAKKAGHMLGYGLLAAAYRRGLGARPEGQPIAWLLAIVYAVTDEFHQSFVPGRNAALLDVMLFDNLGAIFGLIAYSHFRQIREPRSSGGVGG